MARLLEHDSQDVKHVLQLAQRDTEELFSWSSESLEHLQAREAADSLNRSWFLISQAPQLYQLLSEAIPYLQWLSEENESQSLMRIVRRSKKAIKLASRRIHRQ